jgi:hypothetical protein
MRDHIDQPKARKAHQADKNQGDGLYDHAMPIIILALGAFVFRDVEDLARNNRSGPSLGDFRAKHRFAASPLFAANTVAIIPGADGWRMMMRRTLMVRVPGALCG